MIQYTLLPDSERKILKKEYRIRLFIFTLFFLSISIFLATVTLVPAYKLSFSKEQDVIRELKILQEERKDKGVDVIVKDLKNTSDYIQKIKKYSNDQYLVEMINKIITHKNSNISINAFRVDKIASSTLHAVIQGRASTRESLILFKSKLESDNYISSVELPVSDLAKGKNIVFSIRLNIKQKNEN